MAYARLQPLDDTNLYAFMNGRNPSPSADTMKSFADVLADINAKGFNSCVITPEYSNNRNCYYNILAFNMPNITDFYVANNEFIALSGRDTALYLQAFANFDNTSVTSYYYGDAHELTIATTTTLGTLFRFSTTKDNIAYKRRDFDNWAYGAVFLTSANVNLYINGSLPFVYNWQSVPSISGKNGILSLPVLIDTDGNPVTNGSINDFSTFPAKAKVRTLADANI